MGYNFKKYEANFSPLVLMKRPDQVWKSHKTRPYRHKIALIIHVKWQLKIGRVSTTTVSNVSKRAPSTLQIGKRSSHFLKKAVSAKIYIYKKLIKHVMNRTYNFMIKKGIKISYTADAQFWQIFFCENDKKHGKSSTFPIQTGKLLSKL